MHVLEQSEQLLEEVQEQPDRTLLQLLYVFALLKTGKSQQAEKIITEVLDASHQHNPHLKARADYLLGGIKKEKGDFLDGLEKLNQAYEQFAKLEDKQGLSEVIYEQGVMHRRMGDMARALDTYFEVLEKQNELGDEWGRSATLMEIGVVHRLINKEEKALEFLEESQQVRQSIGDHWGQAATLMNLGLTYKALGRLEKALEAQRKSIQIKEDKDDTRGLPPAYHALGEVYAEMEKPKLAQENFQIAYDLAKEYGDKYGVVILGLGLGRMRQKAEEYEAAIEQLVPLLSIAEEINAQELQYKVHKALAEIYSAQQHFKRALAHHQEFHSIKEKVLNEKTALQIQQADAKYEAETAQQEAEIYRLKNVELAKANEEIKEKQQELESAYEEIQSKNQNLSVTLKKLEDIHQKMEDSIRYAQRIQNALLPNQQELASTFTEYFIFYRPRSIVSGDFYWLSSNENETVLVVADCTGHGVPGGFMTVLGKSLLDSVVNEGGQTQPDKILKQLDNQLLAALHAEGQNTIADGMDTSLFTYEKKNHRLLCSGAKNDMYLVRDKSLEVIEASKSPIGGSKLHYRKPKSFHAQRIDVQAGDAFYLASDGFQDQFGGAKKEKFTRKRFRELLTEISHLPMKEQGARLERTFTDWQGEEAQIDDVLVVGIRF